VSNDPALNLSAVQWLVRNPAVLRRRICRCDNSDLEVYRQPVIVKAGKCRLKNTNADQRRAEEEQMAINVVMGIIGVGIPALICAGCIMTRKKKALELPKVAPRYELDRAA
jgi:hypothetical protein